uniref:Uncharacterized protein n=1 Tax=Manihot esculenta TaxID=3983 RepID=A0A2C9V808_MANES
MDRGNPLRHKSLQLWIWFPSSNFNFWTILQIHAVQRPPNSLPCQENPQLYH